MSDSVNNLGKLTLNVITGEEVARNFNEGSLPKNVQILSANLNTERSFWMLTETWSDFLTAGFYIVKLKVASAKEVEQIVRVLPQEEISIEFDIRDKRVYREVFNFSADNPNYYRTFVYNLKKKYRREIVMIDWIYEEGILKMYSNDRFFPKFLEMESTIISQRDRMHICELHVAFGKSVFVCLPPEYELTLARNSADIVTNLKITIGLPNKSAQTLLYLMNKGDSDKAESLYEIQQAEFLLREKRRDSIAAAIGGYFLLSTGQLGFLHDWPNNLADWFPWLPDGPIIHAWQMIKSKNLNIPLIQNRLLEAVQRGIPLFTEGLRLLYEGLSLLDDHLHSDNYEVGMALKKVKRYMESADLNKEYTTLVGESDLLRNIANGFNYY
ncbi:hypothetical protein [uncultured Sphingobacterium sp.]|uniref:hypothetical protein n=1 Tax=uncultured Sphingobacterium sp. TaxID=182688 RepID=UPI00374792F9